MTYDMIIIGGGPAGMSAALYAQRQNLKFCMISTNVGGLANYVPSLKAYLGYQYVTGFELIEKFREHLAQYKVEIKDETVVAVKKLNDAFAVKTGKGEYRTKTVIIATGRRFKKLNIPGEAKYTNKGVSDCTVCDGPVFKGKTVAIIGGGRTGLYATLFMLKIAKKIYLLEQNSYLKVEGGLKHIAEIIRKNKKVEVMTHTSPVEIKGEQFVKELIISVKGKKKRLPVDGVFVEIGYEPNTDFVKGMVKMNDRKEIVVNPECKTSVPGLFAAGDVAFLKEKQVVVSVGEGAKAALSAVLYLEELSK
jgi:alkyl hydroperoxide reductase subunit F